MTSYSYEKVWSDKAIDSSGFHKKQEYKNPKPALQGKTWEAGMVTVGAFTLSPGLVARVDDFTEVRENPEVELPEKIAGKMVHREGDGFYLGESPESPAIGDLRVIHEAAMPGTVSLIAKQKGDTFELIRREGGRQN